MNRRAAQPTPADPATTAIAAATDALRRLPADTPAVMTTGDGRTPFTPPTRVAAIAERLTLNRRDLRGCSPDDAAKRLDSLLDTAREHAGTGLVVAEFEYELGRCFEPRSMAPDRGQDDDPLATLHVAPFGLDFTHDGRPLPFGHADHLCAALLRPGDAIAAAPPPADAFTVGPFRSSRGRTGYEDAVARAVNYIHAGDVFQTNIAHRLAATFTGSPRAAAAALVNALRPAFGFYVEHAPPAGFAHPARGIDLDTTKRVTLSVSPELFVCLDHTGRVVTRPIKGTRPAASARDLIAAPKDLAELNMIVDLMRNDLGRVARLGSVHVDDARMIEQHHAAHAAARHAGVAHAVATVAAQLRPGLGLGQLLRAAFPPGSVTGAPKVRAMQIIDELERAPNFTQRGVYCGAIGLIDAPTGRVTLNVGIRTATVRAAHDHATIELPVGAGIVADSDPTTEWNETLVKARPLVNALHTFITDDDDHDTPQPAHPRDAGAATDLKPNDQLSTRA